MKPQKIPEHKLTAITDSLFILRYDDDGAQRVEPHHFHRDNYFIFAVLMEGHKDVSVDFTEYTLHGGDAVIIFPGQIHASGGQPEGKGFALILAPELISDSDRLALRGIQFGSNIIQLREEALADVGQLFAILRRRKDSCGEVELGLAKAFKSIIIENIPAGESEFEGRYVRLFGRFQDLLETNVRTAKSPSEYASRLNVTEVYLNEAVKIMTGKSVSKFIGEYAMMLAKRELCHTSLPVQEIAYGLGYTDYAYFSRLFKRHAGMSPKAFRRSYLK